MLMFLREPEERSKKQVVLFIVEGSCDQTALENGISSLYELVDENILEVFFHVTKGDITSDNNISTGNIKAHIRDILTNICKKNRLTPDDFSHIIQIVDLDGTYIPEENAKTDPSKDKFYYGDEYIFNKKRKAIIDRNKDKKKKLDYLLSLDKIDNVKYHVLFFSSNLDHFLFRDANLNQDQKENKAIAFSSTELNTFVDVFLKDPDAANKKTYDESWEYIKEGTNSLKRHTNVDLLIRELYLGKEKSCQ